MGNKEQKYGQNKTVPHRGMFYSARDMCVCVCVCVSIYGFLRSEP
jgi:hypothetical protein